jgi:hypothetical protein
VRRSFLFHCAARSIESALARPERSRDRERRLSVKRRTVIAWGMNRLAGAIVGEEETGLAPESLIAAAAEATRLDTRPLADPRLIEALARPYHEP